MKLLTTLLIMTLSQTLWAKENKFECITTNDRSVIFYDMAENWKIDLLVKNKKIGGCDLMITEISDPASAQSTKDIQFEVGNCQYQFDKFKKEFSLVSKGFLKINETQKRASGNILNNSQPLFCRKK